MSPTAGGSAGKRHNYATRSHYYYRENNPQIHERKMLSPLREAFQLMLPSIPLFHRSPPLHRKNIKAAGTRDRNELLDHRITGQPRSEGTESNLMVSLTSFVLL